MQLYTINGEHLCTVDLNYSPYNISSDFNGSVAVINSEEGFIEFFEDEILQPIVKLEIKEDCHGVFISKDIFFGSL